MRNTESHHLKFCGVEDDEENPDKRVKIIRGLDRAEKGRH